MYVLNSRRAGFALVMAAMLAAGLSTGTRLYYLIALALLLMLALGLVARCALTSRACARG